MKQTAVQWYAIESGKLEVERAKGYLTFSQMFDKMLEILKQAKEMEKEQIMDAFNFNNIKWTPKFDDEGNISITNEIICNNSEQYYNETFKQEI